MSAAIDTEAKLSIGFIESMECLAVSSIPEGPEWTYEIKLDGFRLEVVKDGTDTTLFSRRGNVLDQKFPYMAQALKRLPVNTVIDGEFVPLTMKAGQISTCSKLSLGRVSDSLLCLRHSDLEGQRPNPPSTFGASSNS